MNVASIRRLMHGEAFVSPELTTPSCRTDMPPKDRQFDIPCSALPSFASMLDPIGQTECEWDHTSQGMFLDGGY